MASTMTAQSTFLGTSVQAKAPKCVPAQPSPPWPPWVAGIESGRARAPCLPLAGLRRRPAEQQAGCSVLRPGMWLP